MKLAWLLGLACALFAHAAFLLFGGLLLPGGKEDHGTTAEVELLGDVEAEQEEPEPEEEPEPLDPEELQAPEELPPEAESMSRDQELANPNDAPSLDAASLSSIEAALNGSGGGGGDFALALSFGSGGRIGGTGTEGGGDPLETAFSLSELDQKPRAVFQASPMYPAAIRSKKLEGVVTLIFVVDANGKVKEPRVEQSTHTAFDGPALDAVKQWKFEPAVKGGERVACKMRVPIRFQPS
jgi:protein TonB